MPNFFESIRRQFLSFTALIVTFLSPLAAKGNEKADSTPVQNGDAVTAVADAKIQAPEELVEQSVFEETGKATLYSYQVNTDFGIDGKNGLVGSVYKGSEYKRGDNVTIQYGDTQATIKIVSVLNRAEPKGAELNKASIITVIGGKGYAEFVNSIGEEPALVSTGKLVTKELPAPRAIEVPEPAAEPVQPAPEPKPAVEPVNPMLGDAPQVNPAAQETAKVETKPAVDTSKLGPVKQTEADVFNPLKGFELDLGLNKPPFIGTSQNPLKGPIYEPAPWTKAPAATAKVEETPREEATIPVLPDSAILPVEPQNNGNTAALTPARELPSPKVEVSSTQATIAPALPENPGSKVLWALVATIAALAVGVNRVNNVITRRKATANGGVVDAEIVSESNEAVKQPFVPLIDRLFPNKSERKAVEVTPIDWEGRFPRLSKAFKTLTLDGVTPLVKTEGFQRFQRHEHTPLAEKVVSHAKGKLAEHREIISAIAAAEASAFEGQDVGEVKKATPWSKVSGWFTNSSLVVLTSIALSRDGRAAISEDYSEQPVEQPAARSKPAFSFRGYIADALEDFRSLRAAGDMAKAIRETAVDSPFTIAPEDGTPVKLVATPAVEEAAAPKTDTYGINVKPAGITTTKLIVPENTATIGEQIRSQNTGRANKVFVPTEANADIAKQVAVADLSIPAIDREIAAESFVATLEANLADELAATEKAAKKAKTTTNPWFSGDLGDSFDKFVQGGIKENSAVDTGRPIPEGIFATAKTPVPAPAPTEAKLVGVPDPAPVDKAPAPITEKAPVTEEPAKRPQHSAFLAQELGLDSNGTKTTAPRSRLQVSPLAMREIRGVATTDTIPKGRPANTVEPEANPKLPLSEPSIPHMDDEPDVFRPLDDEKPVATLSPVPQARDALPPTQANVIAGAEVKDTAPTSTPETEAANAVVFEDKPTTISAPAGSPAATILAAAEVFTAIAEGSVKPAPKPEAVKAAKPEPIQLTGFQIDLGNGAAEHGSQQNPVRSFVHQLTTQKAPAAKPEEVVKLTKGEKEKPTRNLKESRAELLAAQAIKRQVEAENQELLDLVKQETPPTTHAQPQQQQQQQQQQAGSRSTAADERTPAEKIIVARAIQREPRFGGKGGTVAKWGTVADGTKGTGFNNGKGGNA